MTGVLRGQKPVIGLPLTLSKEARRKALLATGMQADEHQIMEIDDLLHVEDEQTRERLIGVWERIEVEVASEIHQYGPDDDDYETVYSFELKSYEWLHRGDDGWIARNDEGNAIELNRVFVPSPGRTIDIVEQAMMSRDNGREFVGALLDGRPLVEALQDDQHLTLEIVLDAYDRALAAAAELVERAWAVPQAEPHVDFWISSAWDEERILLLSTEKDKERPPLGLCRESDPEAFADALKMIRAVDQLSVSARDYFIFRACDFAASNWFSNPNRPLTDRELVNKVLKQAAGGAKRQHDDELDEQNVKNDYEVDRQAWIAEFGSNRLRLAAQRDYRHDGIYRDERLAAELPGFLGNVGRRSEVKEIINPSENALEEETEVLKLVKRQGLDVSVRLVWINVDDDMNIGLQDGEYVEIDGFLGRHKVYKLVQSDIPF